MSSLQQQKILGPINRGTVLDLSLLHLFRDPSFSRKHRYQAFFNEIC